MPIGKKLFVGWKECRHRRAMSLLRTASQRRRKRWPATFAITLDGALRCRNTASVLSWVESVSGPRVSKDNAGLASLTAASDTHRYAAAIDISRASLAILLLMLTSSVPRS